MSCLFNSLNVLLKPEIKAQKIVDLRQAVCQYMVQHMDDPLIAGEKLSTWLQLINQVEHGSSTSGYINKMRNPSVWGGAPELAVISKMFDVVIHVVYRGRVIASFDNRTEKVSKPNSQLFVNWTGGHYTPIRRR